MSFKSWSQTKGNVAKNQAQNENEKVQGNAKPAAEPQKKPTDPAVENKS